MSWPLVKLGEVAKLINGDRGKNYPSKGSFVDEGIPFINAGCLSNEHTLIEGALNYITEDKFDSLRSGKVEKGDILFCLRGSLGKFALVDTNMKGAIASSLVIIRANEKVHIDYLKHYLGSFLCQREIQAYENGAAQPNLSATDLKNFEIPLSPLTEQKRIAAILDKADAIRQKRKQAIELADEFLRSVFLDMFGDPVTNPKGWEERKLISGLSKVQSGWSANGESYPCTSNEFGVLKVSAVTSGYFKEYENKFVPREKIPEGKRLLFPKRGDLLFSRANTRELVAATCIVTRDHDNVFLPDKLWKIELNESLLPEFLHMLIQQPRFKDKLTSQATGSSGSMLNISKSKFEQTKAIFPSITEQIKFKEIYWKVTKSLTLIEASQAKSDDFFNSLSQKAFSGQL
ncbi:restriction endonuclease subunit S [Vibrio parahaemolyticus]|uniref:restriction endonuclease subunit S n=2 Tax=Vibrio parahaemolyticus TaxID=670 RepID=UPI000409EA5B|nr:restriction endonuclease subunit S [Vibrio parahaemolyticus]MDF4410985.1 restriction endonuclease subunit S [Vibrio parahaemolyticus]MDF4425766.1 restriction endonuclease subunit S [Vibrio parahaemolyticus]MDF4434960.1 restriction endonuclease subunit S [Vibrio parahaemolyticus]MDF4444631.1 restriction endonuclease subunit S [Vibrio parahaemolyticus]HCG7478662.1 restriction endonuclease subunit S [Vibrio parahaemolyticus]